MATQIVAEKIIRVDVVTSAAAQRNIKLLADEVAKVEKNTATMQSSLEKGFGGIAGAASRLTSVLATFGIGTTFAALAKQVLEVSSAYAVLEARLKNVLGSQEAANVATKDVITIAVQTGREVDGVAKLYEKASRSAQQFGVSQDAVRQITIGFAEAIRLSGASTQEAYASLVQFGQALASGRLQGDEFRSLMENNAVFMYELAAAAGVTVAELRKMGTDGKLNAQFLFDTMLKKGADSLNMLERLEEKARSMPLSFAQSLNSLATQTTAAIGELAKALTFTSDDSLGLFGPLIRGIRGVTESIKELGRESAALGEGFFARLMRQLRAGLESDTAQFAPFGIGILSRLLGTDQEGLGKAGNQIRRIGIEAKQLQDQLNKVDAELVELEKVPAARRSQSQTDRLSLLTREADTLQRQVKALTELQSKVSDETVFGGGPFRTPTEPPKIGGGVSDQEKKRIEAAKKAFDEYVQTLKQTRDAEIALSEGRAESLKSAKEEQKILELASELGLKETDSRVRYAIALSKEVAIRKERRAEIEKFEAVRKTGLEAEATEDAKIQQSIERDTAAIDALRQRTRATQEYTTAALEKNLEDAKTLALFAEGQDAEATKRLEARIAALQTAIDKRKELEGVQSDEANLRAQMKQSERDQKEVDKLSESISQSLKTGLGNRNNDIGLQLWENIQDTFRSKTIDLVFDPILDPVSKALATLANQFAQDLAIKMSLSMSESGLSSLFARLIGTADPAIGPQLPTGAVGIERIPYDGFVAKLHRGERVQTAREAEQYRKDRASGGGGATATIAPTYMISIDSRTDASTISAEVQQAVQQGNQQLVEELRSRGMLQ